MGREDEIIKERLRKLDELRKQKINPYPYKFDKKNDVSFCLKSKTGVEVKTAGRIMIKRDLKNIIFAWKK